MKICLIGPIGSGKSTCLEWAKSQGFQTFNSDSVLKESVYVDNSVVNLLKIHALIDSEDQCVSFSDLKKRLQTPSDFETLEKIVHPRLEALLNDWLASDQESSVKIAEIPLVFQVGWQKKFEEIWFIQSASLDLESPEQHNRAQWSSDLDRLIQDRLAQMPAWKKRCSRCIEGLEGFKTEIQKIMNEN